MNNFVKCVNAKCGRFNILFQPKQGERYCSTCKMLLAYDGWGPERIDQPPDNYTSFNGNHRRLSDNMTKGERKRLRKMLKRQKQLPIWSKPEPTPPQMEDTWACNPDVKGCPIWKEKPRVEVAYKMWKDWIDMAGDIKTEWFAYLKGEKISNTHYIIREEYYPPQRVGGATAEPVVEPGTVQEGTIGAIHSHVEMAASFSSVDWNHFSQPVEIVINARGNYEAVVRVQLECGRWSRVNADVYLLGQDDTLLAKIKAVKDRFIKEPEAPQPPTYLGAAKDEPTEHIYSSTRWLSDVEGTEFSTE